MRNEINSYFDNTGRGRLCRAYPRHLAISKVAIKELELLIIDDTLGTVTFGAGH